MTSRGDINRIVLKSQAKIMTSQRIMTLTQQMVLKTRPRINAAKKAIALSDMLIRNIRSQGML